MTTTENAKRTGPLAKWAPKTIGPGEYYTLAQGEIRTFTHTVATGQEITVRLFSVAGGSFTRLDVRSNGGLLPERSGTYQYESDALRGYIATLRWLIQQ